MPPTPSFVGIELIPLVVRNSTPAVRFGPIESRYSYLQAARYTGRPFFVSCHEPSFVKGSIKYTTKNNHDPSLLKAILNLQ